MREELRKLVCPHCGSPLSSGSSPAAIAYNSASVPKHLECAACRKVYPSRDGIIDLGGEIETPRPLSSQWAMEFKPIITLYENIWRPAVTMPFSDLDWEMDKVQELLEVTDDLEVLDLGCGPGNFTRRFAKVVKTGLVVGFDLSYPMLRKGLEAVRKEGASNIMFIRGDVTRWPFGSESFDRVHCAGALHLFPSLALVFSSIFRSLKPGGIFVGATYCRGGSSIKKRFQDYISVAHGFHWFEDHEIERLADNAGFIGWRQFMRKQGIVFRVEKPEMAA